MLSKKFKRLDYIGDGVGVIVNILPSYLSIKITKSNPYIFKESDQMDKIAEKYYKSLESSGIELIIDESNSSEKPNNVIKKESVPTDNPVEVSNEIVNEEVTIKEVTDVTEETSTESVSNASELIEFLDMNYSDEDLKSLAKDAGVKRVRDSWSKEELIDKIINTNPDYVMQLMNK